MDARSKLRPVLLLSLPVVLACSIGAAPADVCDDPQHQCTAPCPPQGNCFSDIECGPWGTCIIFPVVPCLPGACHCIGGFWSCQAICVGFCAQPPDTDGDGVPDFVDNCPTVANPGQENCDHDALGDACDACPCDAESDADGDGVCERIDNCPVEFNPDQADTDADGAGDVCDCRPQDAGDRAPLEVEGVLADALAAGSTRFRWNSGTWADRYEIRRGSVLDPFFSECRTAQDANPLDTEFVEADSPAAGGGFTYLVRAVNDPCGGGPWRRFDSSACP